MAATPAAKAQLRQRLRPLLAALPAATVETQSSLVTQTVLGLEQYRRATNVCIYLHMGGEVMTHRLVEAVFRDGKSCFVPRCTRADMTMVQLDDLADYRSLPRNKWGIPEPPMTPVRTNVFEAGGPDLILLPGLAFDRQRNRLGHGKGYYDKFIKHCRQYTSDTGTTMPALVALALTQQILDEDLPHDALDELPDLVVHPEGAYGKPIACVKQPESEGLQS